MPSVIDYENLLVKLLPTGMAWVGDRIKALSKSYAPECSRADTMIQSLFSESLPSTATECISEWETLVGITSESSVDLATRRQNVIARLNAIGGQSKAYFLNIITSLGYSATITDDFPVLRAGFRAGDLAYDSDWLFAFRVAVITSNQTIAQERIEPLILKLKPAHTVCFFTYSS